jgi:hypothetical protein
MTTTGLRRRIVHLLSEARTEALRLDNLTNAGILSYLIEMSILEVMEQQSAAMDRDAALRARAASRRTRRRGNASG